MTQAQVQAQEAEFAARTLEQEKTRFEQSLRESYQLSIDEARAFSPGKCT